MIPINVLTSTAVPLPMPNIDTDQIIPKQFLKRIERTGYGEFLFFDWRYDLGQPRQHAASPPRLRPQQARVQGLADPDRRKELRLRVVSRTRGLGAQPVRLPRRHRAQLRRHLLLERRQERHRPRPPLRRRRRDAHPALHRKPEAPHHDQPRSPDRHRRLGFNAHFDIDPFRKYCLLNGLDDIGLTLRHEADLDKFESQHDKEFWSAPKASAAERNTPPARALAQWRDNSRDRRRTQVCTPVEPAASSRPARQRSPELPPIQHAGDTDPAQTPALPTRTQSRHQQHDDERD